MHFDKTSKLVVHMKIHKGKPFHCRTCGKRFSSLGSLQGHQKFSHSRLLCARKFKTHADKNNHKCQNNKQQKVGSFPESVSSKEKKKSVKGVSIPPNNKNNDTEHQDGGISIGIQNDTENEKAIGIDSQEDAVNPVVRTSKSQNTKQYKCLTCGKRFKQKGNLHRHRIIHTGEKPYECLICHHRFNQKCNLKSHHIRTHDAFLNKNLSGHRKQEDPINLKVKATKSKLANHLPTYTSDKKYKCATCGKRFYHRQSLVRHNMTHTGEKPYKCVTCGKGFYHGHSLVRHNKTHTGEKPYKCDICGGTFTRKEHLKRHHIRIHQDKTHTTK